MTSPANPLARLLDAWRRLIARLVADTPGYLAGVSLGIVVGVLVTVVTLSAVEGSGITPDDALVTAGASVVAIAAVVVRDA